MDIRPNPNSFLYDDPKAKQVAREMRAKAADTRTPEQKQADSARQADAVDLGFDPATRSIKAKLSGLDAASDAALDTVANAATLAGALIAAGQIPAVKEMVASNRTIPLYQRVHELQPARMAAVLAPSGSARHYANTMSLQATSGGIRVVLRRSFAGSNMWTNQYIRGADLIAVNKKFSARGIASSWWYAKPTLVNEMFPNLTPQKLADSIRTLAESGRATIERTSRLSRLGVSGHVNRRD